MKMTLAELAELVGGTVEGNPELEITGVGSPESILSGEITFAEKPFSVKAALLSDAAAVIVREDARGEGKDLLRVRNPRLAFAMVVAAFFPEEKPVPGVHESAFVDPSATLGEDVSVEPNAVVMAGADLGDRVIIGAGSVVGRRAVIGADSRLHSLVSVYRDVRLGERVIIHSGAVLGSDGFGYVDTPEGKVKFPQVGTLIIADDVEIGAGTTIDRAALNATVIGLGTKIDNLVQIAHNVEIGEHCAISGQTGIAGTTTVGNRVIMGGNCGIADHVTIEDDVILGARGGFAPGKRVKAGVYWGAPALPISEAKRMMSEQRRLGKLREKVEDLARRLTEMENRE